MSELNISMDELLKEVEKLTNVDGFTSEEFATAGGWSRSWTTERLRRLVLVGKIMYVGKRRQLRMDGVPYWAPVYRVKEKEKE